jgi:nucleosome assembly protein 1-like 1
VPDISEDNEAEEEIVSPGVQSAMLGLVQGRLSSLVGQSSGYIESLPPGIKKNVEALKGIQVKQNELQNQYKRECLELEKKVCCVALISSRQLIDPSFSISNCRSHSTNVDPRSPLARPHLQPQKLKPANNNH